MGIALPLPQPHFRFSQHSPSLETGDGDVTNCSDLFPGPWSYTSHVSQGQR